jgi:hypothetical protein
MKLPAPVFFAHCAVVVCVVFVVYSAERYFTLASAVAPNVAALAPTSASKVNEAIAALLPESERGNAAKAMLTQQPSEPQILHDLLVSLTSAHTRLARNNLIGWTVALILSLCVTLLLRRAKHSAG